MTNTIIILCAWCKREMGQVKTTGYGSISHGICYPCYLELRAELEATP